MHRTIRPVGPVGRRDDDIAVVIVIAAVPGVVEPHAVIDIGAATAATAGASATREQTERNAHHGNSERDF
jgi:hypothetical protein